MEIRDQKAGASGGGPLPPNHTEIDLKTGQQKAYIVLTEDERAKGFVRPVRLEYTHLLCGTNTRMAQDIAETYARDPQFYSGTFCVHCRAHYRLDQFVWKGTKEKLGS